MQVKLSEKILFITTVPLGSEIERPQLVQIEGMSDKGAAKALEIVIEHQLELLQRWEEIYG